MKKKIYKIDFFFYLIIFLLTFYSRLGYWNLIQIGNNADEISFLLIGREIMNGKIPYIDFFEPKTTFSFIPYILANLFENPYTGLRFIGSVMLLISAILIKKQSTKIFGRNIAFLLAILFIVLNAEERYQQVNLSLFSSIFLLSVSYILLNKKIFNYQYFLIGFFISSLCLIRLNFFPISIAIFFIIYFAIEKKYFIKKIFLIISGATLPIIGFILPFLVINNGKEIILNQITNLANYGDELNFFWNLREIIRYLLGSFISPIFIITFFIISTGLIYKNKKYFLIQSLFLLSFLSILIVKTSIYQFQNFFPYMILSFGIFLKEINLQKSLIKSNIFPKAGLVYKNFGKIIVVCLLIPIIFNSSIINIKNILINKKELVQFDRSEYNRNKVAIENLKKIISEKDTLFSTQNFFYLSLKKDLMHPIIHFSNFLRLDVFKKINGIEYYDNKNHGSKELLNILKKNKPTWLILDNDFFDKKSSYEYQEFVKKNWNFINIISANQKYYLFKIKD